MRGTQAIAAILAIAGPSLWIGGTAAYAQGAATGKTVKVCGKGGTGCMETQVRRTALGKQYRSPKGQWRDCEGDCRDTIRKRHLEFWLRHGG